MQVCFVKYCNHKYQLLFAITLFCNLSKITGSLQQISKTCKDWLRARNVCNVEALVNPAEIFYRRIKVKDDNFKRYSANSILAMSFLFSGL